MAKEKTKESTLTSEEIRLQENYSGRAAWLQWGPYLSERQWGTVREDYSTDGSAWDYFPHDQARSRVYRWGEDGIAGISDDYHDYVSLSRCGMAKTPFSKSGSSV